MAVVALFAGEFNSYNFNFSVPTGSGSGGQNRHLAAVALSWGWRDMLPWILLGALAVVALIFLLLYVHSVFRFILFDSVLTGRCRIRESWHRHEGHGLWFFAWLVIYEWLTVLALLIVVGLPILGLWHAGIFAHAGDHIALLVVTIFFLIILFVALLVVAWVVRTIVRDFLVPIMALENVSVVDAWHVYKPTLLQAKASAAGYLGFKLLLALGVGIVAAMVSLFVFFILLIPGVAFAIMVAAMIASGKPGLVIGILLAIVGVIIFLVLVLSASGMLSVPIAVFFQSYALYYVGSRYRRLGALLWPPAPAPEDAAGALPENPVPA